MNDWEMVAAPAMSAYMTTKDQNGLSGLMVRLALAGHDEGEIAALAVTTLGQQPHEVQTWWMDECNCDGHSN